MNGKQPRIEDLDRLTGILKKNVAEARIASLLGAAKGGTVFLCNIDNLKRINAQHGHLAGDECLKKAAQILLYLSRSNDVIGRRSGIEFLLFMPGCREEEQARAMCGRIENRFRTECGKEKEKTWGPLSVTVVYAVWRPGDTCKRLLLRADEELERQRAEEFLSQKRQEKRRDHYIKDVDRIRRELNEQIKKTGAYCPDYEAFKGIYRFLERGLIRGGQKACIILITVVDGEGRSLHPNEKDILMEELGETIGAALRIGDVYARYSSSQYIILVIDTAENQTDIIVERIRENFLADSHGNNILVHHCYELQPARVEDAI